jgi:NAD-dependent dihydropyrimidine dehydrogenase PreA subunit
MRRRGPVEYEVYLIGVDSARCDGCGECALICPTDVFEMRGDRSHPVRPENCLNCGGCVGVCPTCAVTVVEI